MMIIIVIISINRTNRYTGLLFNFLQKTQSDPTTERIRDKFIVALFLGESESTIVVLGDLAFDNLVATKSL